MKENKEMTENKTPICPHCGQDMKKWRVPFNSTWSHDFLYICFSDDCPYFIKGWEHMWEQQKTKASYRCRWDEDNDKYVPLPVWSYDALKDDII